MKLVHLSQYDDPTGTAGTGGTDFPEPAELLDAVEAFIRRFCQLPDEAAYVAVTLWVAHTHCLDAFETSPRLAVLSPEPGSGKTRLLEIIELLVPNPKFTYNVSVAVLYRSMTPDKDGNVERPTILMDEADTFFGPRASKDHEDLRGFVNAGYRQGATAERMAMRGNSMVTETFPSFAAVCLAGLDDLPDTIMTRSVVIRMRRRAPNETVEPYRRRRNAGEGHQLSDQLAQWAGTVIAELGEAWPDLPDCITDRAADVWEPLIAIADAMGGDWPERSRLAAEAFVKAASENSTASLNIKLLAALRDVYREQGDPVRLATKVLLDKLKEREDEPWSDLRGKPLDAQGLAYRLRKYDVHPEKYREDGGQQRGYLRADLTDAWQRYLPPLPPVLESLSHPSHPEQLDLAEQTGLKVCAIPDCQQPRAEGRAVCAKCADKDPAQREDPGISRGLTTKG